MKLEEKRAIAATKQYLAQYIAADIDLFNLLLPQLFFPGQDDKLLAQVLLASIQDKEIDQEKLEQVLRDLEGFAQVSLYQQEAKLKARQAQEAQTKGKLEALLTRANDSTVELSPNLETSATPSSNSKGGTDALEQQPLATATSKAENHQASAYAKASVEAATIASKDTSIDASIYNSQHSTIDGEEEFFDPSLEYQAGAGDFNIFDEEDIVDYNSLNADDYDEFEQSDEQDEFGDLNPTTQDKFAGVAREFKDKFKGEFRSELGGELRGEFKGDINNKLTGELTEEFTGDIDAAFADFADLDAEIALTRGQKNIQQVESFYHGLSKTMQSNLKKAASQIFAQALPGQEYYGDFTLEKSYPAVYWNDAIPAALREMDPELFASPIFAHAQEPWLVKYSEQAELDLDSLDAGQSLQNLYPHLSYLEQNYLQYNYTLALANKPTALAGMRAEPLEVLPTRDNTANAANKKNANSADANSADANTANANTANANTANANTTKVVNTVATTSDSLEDISSSLLDYTKFNYVPNKLVESKAWYHLSDLLLNNAVLNKMHCFDISHDRGMFTKGSAVAANDQGLVVSDYRHFNIEGITGGDDYAAMEQAVYKRYHSEVDISLMPMVVLIDGGQNQINVANKSLLPILNRLRAIETYTTLVTQGQNLFSHLAKKNYQLFSGLAANQIVLLAQGFVYQNLVQCVSKFANSGTALPSIDLLMRLYLNQKAQANPDYALSLNYFVYQQAQQQVTQTYSYEQGLFSCFSDLAFDNKTHYGREFSFLAQLPANITVKEFKDLILNAYTCFEYLYQIKTIGVTKQENRKLYAEKFIDGVTGEEIHIPLQSRELYYILQLRDAAHNYANRKRVAKREQEFVTGKDILDNMPGIGKASIDKLYAAFKDTATIKNELTTVANPQALLKEIGLTPKAIQALLANLEQIPD
ncbi:hypothetical protein [Psittacicella hinzii]|uniref:UvrC family homology region profile domain-containing protein n=1 Tax=Psittacicella hinzii TaxID=2028575 RepID=A0A3A1YMI1_9GAMM|nr:hypothetical protein [Psittacicella hinzii]RIY38449.1 hypothetical protein CKF58_04310 [Psittacicella hinzii]